MEGQTMYYAIIGDIINSKEINKLQRNKVQIKLRDILNDINKLYSKDIAAKFLITLGDEFQGLLIEQSNAIKIIDYIQFNMYPIKLRFGVGIGRIYTDIDKEVALGADGPAYHNARKMINLLKTLQKGKMSGSSNIMIGDNRIENAEKLKLINSNLQLCSFIETKWTDKQRQLIKMIYMQEKTQNEAAVELQVAQSSVQRRLKSAGYHDFMNAREIQMESLIKLGREKSE
jgi:hypothetical protein